MDHARLIGQGPTLNKTPRRHACGTRTTRPRGLRVACQAVLCCACFTQAAAADVAPVPETPAPSAALTEIVVEAPEPRYVAPTRYDRVGRIWAPVLINEKGPFRLVLDTGASDSAVNADVAMALGVPIDADDAVILQGVTGARQVPSIKIDSLVLGDLELGLKRLPIIVDALGGAEGVLGTDGLQDKRIFIDFGNDKITILRSHHEPAPRGFVTVPINIEGGLLLVADVTIGRVTAKAIIDTGGQETIANAALGDVLRRRVNPEEIRADDVQGVTLDVQRGDRMNSPPISIGDLKIRGVQITAGDMVIFEHWKMTKKPALLIGMDVLGLFDTLIIDYRRRELQVRMRAEH